MRFNLLMTNAFIGMCRGVNGLPDVLFHLGFQDGPVELEFSLESGGSVKPELIAESEVLGCSLVFEWKSGKNIEPDQARRYARITPKSLRERALLTPKASTRHDVVYVGEEAHFGTLKMGLDQAGLSFPILVKSKVGLELKANSFCDPQLDAGFAEPLSLDWEQCPTMFIPVDAASEEWEIADVIFPHIWAHMARLERFIEQTALVHSAFRAWGNMSVTEQNLVLAKVKRVLSDAAGNEFKEFFSYQHGTGNKPGGLRIQKNPFRQGKSNQSERKRLRDVQAKFIRIKQGKESRQRSLFEDEV